jgi:hypothetical protein
MSMTKIELDKETLIRGQSRLFKGCCALEISKYSSYVFWVEGLAIILLTP